MLYLEDADGIVLAPEHDVASLAPEWRDRWRAVLRDGTVLHRPVPPPAGPWTSAGDSWLHPALVHRNRAGEWQDPAGFTYPCVELGPVPPLPTENVVPGLPCNSSQVLSLSPHGKQCVWHTDLGDFPSQQTLEEAALLHPDLVLFYRRVYVNRNRMRRIQLGAGRIYSLQLDDGSILGTFTQGIQKAFAERLGLPHFNQLEPRTPAYANYRLRDYPVELAVASSAQLRAWFHSERHLLANLIYQALSYHQLGIEREYGTDPNGFFYHPVWCTLVRAGYMEGPEQPDRRPPTPGSERQRLFNLFQRLVDEMVGHYRLFTYAELGFDDPGGFTLGERRPDIMLVVEKNSLAKYARILATEFGVSLLVTGGSPSLLQMGFVAPKLRAHAPIHRINYVDFDPMGWVNADATGKQLQRFGTETHPSEEFLVRAECFTEEELELYSLPCSQEGSAAALAREWVKRSGGIHGQMRMIHANHLHPIERVRTRMAEAMARLE